jgi:hypothetical protein
MKFLPHILLSAILPLLAACSSADREVPAIPGPARKVTSQEALAIAHAYASMKWTPRPENARHGIDPGGILVHTPDHGLAAHGFARGSWKPGIVQTGMPYQWGGFDTPRTFVQRVRRGAAAGDIATPYKRSGGDAVVSEEAAGIDCSGFVSRCWRLTRSISTAELPGITDEITWQQLLPGDILLKDGHVLLFAGWQRPGSIILAYEAGPFPAWKVAANAMPTDLLFQQNYHPRRYRHIIHKTP